MPLTGIIPQQSFELVRDRIGSILGTEVLNQFTLSANSALDADIWIERFVPFGHEELPAINVNFDSGNFSSHDQVQADGGYRFNIDCYSSAKTSSSKDGDSLAIINLHRLIGVCRAILENSVYKTLGFNAPFVMNRHIESMQIADPGKQDAASTVMGRLVMNVRLPETTELLSPTDLNSYYTTVKLEETENGYLYIGNGT